MRYLSLLILFFSYVSMADPSLKSFVDEHLKNFSGDKQSFQRLRKDMLARKKAVKKNKDIKLDQRIELYSLVEFLSYIDDDIQKKDCEKTRTKIIHNFSPQDPRPKKIPWAPVKALGYLSKICQKL